MKNKAGKISGFITGFAGFLLTFKIFILGNIPPEDEIAPGMVVIAAVFTGLLCAYLGFLIQNNFIKKGE